MNNKNDLFSRIASVKIGIASPERILELSHGEVKKPETINYRSYKAEKDGLFCERIFGPEKSYSCACGKYEGEKYKGIQCEKCGVIVAPKEVRKRWMGHIELAAPVTHIWFLKTQPTSIIGTVLDMKNKDLQKIVYYGFMETKETVYVVVDPKSSYFERGDILYASEYEIISKYFDIDVRKVYKVEKTIDKALQSDIEGRVISVVEEELPTDKVITKVTIAPELFFTDKVYPGMEVVKKDGEFVEKGDLILKGTTIKPYLSEIDGVVERDEGSNIITIKGEDREVNYSIPEGIEIIVKRSDKVKAGQALTKELKIKDLIAPTHGKIKYFDCEFSVQENGIFINDLGKLSIYEDASKKVFPLVEGAMTFVDAGDYVNERDEIADFFMLPDEWLTDEEYKEFAEVYGEKSITLKEIIEITRATYAVTKIDPEVKKEILEKVGEKIDIGTLIYDTKYTTYKKLYGDKFEAKQGAEAIMELLKNVDIEKNIRKLRKQLDNVKKGSQTENKIAKKLGILEGIYRSGNNPEWMVLKRIPVMPPDLRPMVPLDGGRFATTDINELYRRVINRNIRLKNLMAMGAPEIVIRNEKRMLQESVDNLIENGKSGKPLVNRNKRVLKSLADLMKGKKGRFRQNLLGKRVDYSGRAVIAVGPDLKFYECGIPKEMAVELFKPYILSILSKERIGNKIVTKQTVKKNKKIATKQVEDLDPKVWEVLEKVVKNHPVMLNRAPTLHRLSIQAFVPKLIEGNAIRLHPLVCPPFNADFDGDQMAIHVPLSAPAIAEAKTLMLSKNNILKPANGQPISMPSKDIILGLYYLTMMDEKSKKNEIRTFADKFEAEFAHFAGVITLHEPIRVLIDDEYIETTLGRVILNEVLPKENRVYSKTLNKKEVNKLVGEIFKMHGSDKTSEILDSLKRLGFHYSTISGVTISITDATITKRREEIIQEAQKKVDAIREKYDEGYLTEEDRYNSIISVWKETTEKVKNEALIALKKDKRNPLWIMLDSGARGSAAQANQLCGMRGLMADPSGKTIEIPILSNFRQGLSVLEFFNSSHGARKGSVDTALRTSNAGYLTRRLVDVSQDIVVDSLDCGTDDGLIMSPLRNYEGDIVEEMSERVYGRTLSMPILDPDTKEVVRFVHKKEVNIAELERYIEQDNKVIIDNVAIPLLIKKQRMKNHLIKKYVGKEATPEIVDSLKEDSIFRLNVTIHTNNFFEKDFLIKEDEANFIANFHKEIEVASKVKKNEVKDLLSKGFVVMAYSSKAFPNIESYNTEKGVLHILDENTPIKDFKEFYVFKSVDTMSIASVRDDNGTEIVKTDEIITKKTAVRLFDRGVETIDVRPIIKVRSPLTCKSKNGVCAKCYGLDLARYTMVSMGEAVGIIAAQSIGEPGTQLTMRTFHSGGVASDEDITQGLPRVEELFEARKKQKRAQAIVAKYTGTVTNIEDGEKDEKKDIQYKNVTIVDDDGYEEVYKIPETHNITVKVGDRVLKSQPITIGEIKSRLLMDTFEDEEAIPMVQRELLKEVQKVYKSNGVDIHDKHMEIIIRRMLERVLVIDSGDEEDVYPGDLLKYVEVQERNQKIAEHNSKIEDIKKELVGTILARDVVVVKAVDGEDSDVTVLKRGTLLREEEISILERENIKKVSIFRNIPEGLESVETSDGHIVYKDLELIDEKPTKLPLNVLKPIRFKRLVLGIAKVSQETKSFLSSASFQKTSQALTLAAVYGKTDYLEGIKENVIAGQKIPAGTGLKPYKNISYVLKMNDKNFEDQQESNLEQPSA
jgi:DNA-directed RNA polymerase subunit beta'